jgi:hypothetical protein
MTAPRLKPDAMPNWPAMLAVDLAAAYVGLAPTTFLSGVAQQIYPQPVGILGRKLWHLKALQEAVDRLATPDGTMSKAEAMKALGIGAGGRNGKGKVDAVRHRTA